MPPAAAVFVAFAEIAPIVGAVGVGLSVVGKITKSKEMSDIGGVMALASGAASIASGVLGAGETVAGTGLGGAGGAMGQSGDYGLAGIGLDSGSVSTGLSQANDYGLLGSSAQATNGLDAFSKTYEPNGGMPAMAPAQAAATPTVSTGYPQNNETYTSVDTMQADAPVAPPPDSSTTGLRAWFSSLDPRTKNTLLQAGAGAVGGLFNGWTDDQKRAFEREKYNLVVSNSNAQPSINFSKPTGLLASAQR